MNALTHTVFSSAWREAALAVGAVDAIVVISAHWQTPGTQVTAMERPQTIHDFGGFPKELFEMQYPAPGAPALAETIIELLSGITPVQKNFNWGLDHGAWSVLVHMYPEANVPVLQLSIDADASPEHYFVIGKALRALRDKGILLVGSGNIVHNLRLVDWARLNEADYASDWARDAMKVAGNLITEKDWQKLVDFKNLPQSMQIAINSAEHYFPLLYILGAGYSDEPVMLFNDNAVGGALSMTCVRLG
jgi:4,5-DOPA dioxygenase extradiol